MGILSSVTLVSVFFGMAQANESGSAAVQAAAVGQSEGTSPIGAIFGPNHFDKDFGFVVGLKAWANQWDMPVSTVGYSAIVSPTGINRPTNNDTIISFESDQETSLVPALMLRYKNFFVGTSFIPEKDYSFDTQQVGTVSIVGKDNAFSQQFPKLHDVITHLPGMSDNFIVSLYDTPTAKRKEWDVNLGYFVTPNLALTLGYKELDRSYQHSILAMVEQCGCDTTVFLKNFTQQNSYLTAKGPIIGLSGSAPVGKGFNLYGNMAFGWLKVDEDVSAFFNTPETYNSNDGRYYFGEVGLNYSFPLDAALSSVTLGGGYRFQRLEYSSGNAGDQNDSTHGFTLSVSASF